MLYQVIIVIHILLGIGIVGLVLMQHGKGADAGAAFGSGSSGTVFGAQGSASFLSRTTAIFAALFFTTSLGLAMLSGYSGKKADIIDTISIEESKAVSDVPLNQSKPAAETVQVEKLPDAPAIKEVEQAPSAAPAAKE
ncbi:preprotein translocase subunit SecG [Methylomonas sp. AM2-LC]|uniref:preprotein translocase subunit SecG n=1 Tax=Methylomonas sp. AM2-LC TaxID=3153301 RepID=UPI003266A8C8